MSEDNTVKFHYHCVRQPPVYSSQPLLPIHHQYISLCANLEDKTTTSLSTHASTVALLHSTLLYC